MKASSTCALSDSAPTSLAPTAPSPIQTYLGELHARYAGLRDGTVATYIPELAKADPEWFGCCLVTTDGQIYAVGDAEVPFTIQSISKPFVYATALADRGKEAVLAKIGVEPTGDAFNAISLHPETGQPSNPMINAGAIATTGLVAGRTPEEQWQRILESFGQFAGHELAIDEQVYHSESVTGFRNRAIGYMLRNFGIIEGDPTPIAENYFRQCSIAVTCRDLGVMAATLANGGINPVTGLRALEQEHVESVLSVMASCGMYDYAGGWLYHVGMPAKSGVSGGILAVLPGRLGISVFSPPLDAKGNSVRGIEVCNQLSRDFALHLFCVPVPGRLVIKRRYSAVEMSSNRVRSFRAAKLLREHGDRIQVYELQGELTFDTTEVVMRDIIEKIEQMEFVLLDLKRVASVNRSAGRLLRELLNVLAERDKHLILTHVEGKPAITGAMAAPPGRQELAHYHTFEDNDMALEWCEDQVIARWSRTAAGAEMISPDEFELLAGLSTTELAAVQSTLRPVCFRRGETIIEIGAEPADGFYLLISGEVSVGIPLASGRYKRIATLSAGMSFGEMAVIEDTTRSATVRADTDVECYVMRLDAFERVSMRHPGIKVALLANLARSLSKKLRQANRTISVLAQ
jgi:glutaminase